MSGFVFNNSANKLNRVESVKEKPGPKFAKIDEGEVSKQNDCKKSSNRNNYGRGYNRGRGRGNYGRGYNSGSRKFTVPSSSSNVRGKNYVKSNKNTTAIILNDIEICNYAGWKLYFPVDTYDENNDIVKKLPIIKNYLTKIAHAKNSEIEKHNCFTVDIKAMLDDDAFILEWPDFISDLRSTPTNVIRSFGLVMYQIVRDEKYHNFLISSNSQIKEDEKLDYINSVPYICARFRGLEPLLPLKQLKVENFNKFVTVKGTVVRISNVKPLCTKLAFQCNKCKAIIKVLQPSGNFTKPTRCTSRECFCRSFKPLLNSEFTEVIPWQTLRLQEMFTDENNENGRVPRTVECELFRDLVDRCVPGDIVTVTGIVKVNDPKEKKIGGKKNKSTFLFYILVNSVVCLKEKNLESDEILPGGLQLQLSDLYAVRDIHSQSKLFRLLVTSLCPSICGHEVVKAGLILCLFGGTQRYLDDNNRVPVRGDSHILIVGDPGVGKSQLLLACSNVSPRGVYVCGNATTTSGLTVTVAKESGGETTLEAGALVLADQGSCCIDEFDKMSNQHHALLEAMEQQTISVCKGGIFSILPARTSIIAAANPVGGHYNKSKTVAENLKLGSALLSRFDLVFIVLDSADKELDHKLSSHIMGMHSEKSNSETLLKNNSSVSNNHLLNIKNQLTLNLQFELDENPQLIPPDILRKYIAYARKYVHPKLSPEACEILKNFYIELRKQHQTPHSTPITNRQLESLIRLTEARARTELRELCTADDAQEVVNIMKCSMVDTYSDEFGVMDFERSVHGSGMSKRSKAKSFLSVLNRAAERTNNTFFTAPQMESLAKDAKLDTSCFRDFVDSLNDHGYLLKKGPNLYQLQTV